MTTSSKSSGDPAGVQAKDRTARDLTGPDRLAPAGRSGTRPKRQIPQDLPPEVAPAGAGATALALAAADSPASTGHGAGDPSGREAYLWLRVGVADYAVPVADLLEIRAWETPTPLADGASAVRGVISVRGQVLPVIDLRQRLQGAADVIDAERVILVVRIDGRLFGLIVDAVIDFLLPDPAEILAAPAGGLVQHVDHMIGLLPRAQRMLILIRAGGLLESCGLSD